MQAQKNTSIEDPITTVTTFLSRPDGSEVKIVATLSFGIDGKPYQSTDVFRRNGLDSNWHYCSDQPHPDWLSMSVDEYIKRGRSEKFRTVTHGEIFKACEPLGLNLRAFEQGAQA